jgi:hypothetical protein
MSGQDTPTPHYVDRDGWRERLALHAHLARWGQEPCSVSMADGQPDDDPIALEALTHEQWTEADTAKLQRHAQCEPVITGRVLLRQSVAGASGKVLEVRIELSPDGKRNWFVLTALHTGRVVTQTYTHKGVAYWVAELSKWGWEVRYV